MIEVTFIPLWLCLDRLAAPRSGPGTLPRLKCAGPFMSHMERNPSCQFEGLV